MFLRAALLSCLAAAPALSADREVDVELYLAVDVSRSMSPMELEIQRRGYAEALVSDAVLGVIANGFIGEIAVSYVEWAGNHAQRVVVDWTVIGSRADAVAVADRLYAHFEPAMRRTSISGALEHALSSIEENDFTGLRRVVDVSGDGPNNEGAPVERARDAVLRAGIVINGLPIMVNGEAGDRWNIADLDRYYTDCVIGGPGAFVIPVTDWDQFAGAVRRKLVLEIAGIARLPVVRVQMAQPYDCMIGEKLREQRRLYWGNP